MTFIDTTGRPWKVAPFSFPLSDTFGPLDRQEKVTVDFLFRWCAGSEAWVPLRPWTEEDALAAKKLGRLSAFETALWDSVSERLGR